MVEQACKRGLGQYSRKNIEIWPKHPRGRQVACDCRSHFWIRGKFVFRCSPTSDISHFWEGFRLIFNIVSVLHQNEGGIGKSIPDAQEISRGRSPREISRVEGNLEGGGDGFPNTSRVLVEYGHSLIINLSTGSGSENPSLWTGKVWQC